MKISSDVVDAVNETRSELTPLLNKLDFTTFSKYNIGYLKYQTNPTKYFIDLEIDRFLHTANYINSFFPYSSRLLDIGLFIPVLPITLVKLGYRVAAIEKLAIYKDALNPIIDYVTSTYDLQIYDIDIINDDISQLNRQFDIVLLMAILEHLNGSPKQLLEKCKGFLKPSGNLFAEVPNIASISKRISFLLKGKSPLPEYSEYFLSDYPFEGHNREYSANELQYALTTVGFEIKQKNCYNLKPSPEERIPSRIMKVLSKYGDPNWRDVIWTVSEIKNK